MTTARDIIKSALRKIQVLGKGASLDSDEAQDGLEALNDMLAIWSAEGNLIFTETIETFSLNSSIVYTIGSGGDFDTTRPNYISAVYVTQGEVDYILQSIDGQQYASIIDKEDGSFPRRYYYNAGFPLASIYLDAQPTSVSSITIHSFKPLALFSDLDTVFAMPPEYKAALVYNLAIWLAPEYEKPVPKEVVNLASKSKGAVITQNTRNENFVSSLSDVPSRRGQTGNVYNGFFN
tara:strand:+ start:3272 stop:3976 length:705 start_codon:yes stop_codon:yes gene_type:complete